MVDLSNARHVRLISASSVAWGFSVGALGIAFGVVGTLLPWWWLAVPLLGALVCMIVVYPARARLADRATLVLNPQLHTPLAVELVALPFFISLRQRPLIALGLIFGLLVFSLMRRRTTQERLNLVPTGLFMLCVLLVCWRGVFANWGEAERLYSIVGLYLLVAAILVITAKSVSRATAYASLLAGMTLYLVANIAGWIAGFKSPSSLVRVGGYESSGGLFGASRVFFPFARAINEPSFVAAALIVAVAAMIAMRELPRWYHWLGVIAGVIVILASNSRTPILFAVPVIFLLFVAPRATRRAAPYVVGFAMLLPFLLTQIRPIIGWVASALAANSYLSRGQNVEQIGGLGTRDVIWSRSVDFWANNVVDSTHQLVGYGYNGHAESGALATYVAGIGEFLTNPAALTMHNSLLQTLFDAGLLGAAIFFGITVFSVHRYGRDASLLPMFAVVIMLGLSATTEIAMAPGFSQMPVFLLLYLLVFAPLKSAPRGAVRSGVAASGAQPSEHMHSD